MSTSSSPPEDKPPALPPTPFSPPSSPPPTSPLPLNTSNYNTAHLPARLLTDAAAALSAALLVAPVITLLDRAIIENASGRLALLPSLLRSSHHLVTRPHLFVASRPFRLIFGLYFSTYLTANTIDTATTTLSSAPLPPSTVSTGAPKFLATSAVNMTLCLRKDAVFARLFGTVASRAVPTRSYGVFAARDALTVFASFNVPPLLAPHLGDGGAWKAQMLAPAGMQIISTPLHLLGLDFYNRAGGIGGWERWRRVRRDWGMSALARMGRIVPAFGVGGVVNARVRREGMERVEERG